MSSRKATLLRIAQAMSAGDIEHVSEWFTEDFTLHDPSYGGFRAGHSGARDMLRSLAEHVPQARIEALDMVEEGDRVAVRWRFAGTKDGKPVYLSAVAIYRFEGDRIAEDWGIAAKADWPTMATSPDQQGSVSNHDRQQPTGVGFELLNGPSTSQLPNIKASRSTSNDRRS
jgi:predicted ester cyclase